MGHPFLSLGNIAHCSRLVSSSAISHLQQYPYRLAFLNSVPPEDRLKQISIHSPSSVSTAKWSEPEGRNKPVQKDEHHDLGEVHPQAGSPACSEHQEAVRRLLVLPLFNPMHTCVLICQSQNQTGSSCLLPRLTYVEPPRIKHGGVFVNRRIIVQGPRIDVHNPALVDLKPCCDTFSILGSSSAHFRIIVRICRP